jgi:sulfur carrier protein
MTLTINGESQSSTAETLSALIETLGMKPDRVAIELNREIVPRDQWPQTALHEGDRLEIVHFVGGGSDNANTLLGRAQSLKDLWSMRSFALLRMIPSEALCSGQLPVVN